MRTKALSNGPDPGAFDVAADAEAEIAAGGARLALMAAERLDAADRVERLGEGARIIAAVVDDRLAVAIGDADPVRHLVGADHVAAADFGRLQAQGPRRQIDDPLHREGGFRAAGAAIGRVRHLVGDGDAARGGQVLDLVGAGQMHRGVVGDARADRVPGAAIDQVIVAQRQDMAVIVKADLDIVQLVARMRRTHQVLAAAFDPAHRPAEPAGEKGDQEILGIDMALAAKAAADIERDAAHPRLGQTEQRGGFAPHPMHHLGRGPDRRRIGARIIGGDHAAAFHRQCGVAVVVEAAAQPVRGAGQRRLGIAPADREGADQVGVQPVVDQRAVRAQGSLGIDHRRQFLEVETRRLGRVLGLVAAFGDDDRDRLADMAHLVMGQQRLLRD